MELTDPSAGLLRRWGSAAEPPPDLPDLVRYGLVADGREVGLAALAERGGTAVLATLWIDPARRGAGHGRRALAAIEERCRRRGLTALETEAGPGPARRLFADWTVASRRLELAVGEPPVLPEGVTAAAMAAPGFAAWRERAVDGFADSIAAGSRIPIADARRRARQTFDDLLPGGVDTAGHEFWSLRHGGTPVATLWVHIDRARGFAFIYKVESDPAHRGRGYGRAATRLAETRALAAGLDRVRLHVFAHNAVANRLYESLGYRVTEVNLRKPL